MTASGRVSPRRAHQQAAQHQPQSPPPSHRGRRGSGLANAMTVVLAAVLPIAGVVTIGASYHASLSGDEYRGFTLFWLGMALGYAPLVAMITMPDTLRGHRQLAVVCLALFSFAPKYLRNPGGPLYFDEWAHWTQINDTVATHRLYLPNDQVPIVEYYPGLHTLGSALVQTTGLSAWNATVLVIAAAHVLAALAAFLLGETMLSARAAGLAAIVYMSNAAWVYFDTQIAYESLGVTLVLWTMYFAARLYQSQAGVDRLRWGSLMIVSGLCCVVTHHLSTYFLCGMLLLCVVTLSGASIVVLLRRADWSPWPAFWLALPSVAVAVAMGVYVHYVAPQTTTYLGSSNVEAMSQLFQLGRGGSGQRTPFGGSQAPAYERVLGFVAPAIIGLVVLRHFVASRAFTRDYRRGMALPMSLVATMYLLSVPLVITEAGAESARRSWAFTYLGVAMVAGAVAAPAWRRRPIVTSLGVFACTAALVIGNLAVGQNVSYRFPGKYLYGSDTRSLTDNMAAAMRWWSGVRPPGSGVVTDRYTGVLFQSQPDAAVATSQLGRVWDFLLDDEPIDAGFAQALQQNKMYYLVVDKKITTALPMLEAYFTPTEDASVRPSTPVAPAIIERWRRTPYTTRVFDSDQIAIYRLDPRYVSVLPAATPAAAAAAASHQVANRRSGGSS